MGTAFALLLVLTLVVTLMGAAFRWAAARGVAREDPEARDRAVAAAVAVGVMRAVRPTTALRRRITVGLRNMQPGLVRLRTL